MTRVAGLVVALGAVALPLAHSAAQETIKELSPVTDAMLANPPPADWLSWRRTLDSWGYSPLNEINRNNVSRLKMTWTRGIVSGRTVESTPLVYNGTMYIPNPGDIIMAMDAKTGDLKWEYRRKYPGGVNGGTNRNMAIWGTTLIDAGADNAMYAVDARTGELVWETQVLKAGVRANAGSGPIIVFALLCWGSSLFIPRTGEGAPDLVVARNIAASTVRLLQHLRIDEHLPWGPLATSWFWLRGAVVVSVVPRLVKNVLGGM